MVKHIYIAFLLLLPIITLGQTLEATVNKQSVAVGEHFKVEFKTELAGANFSPPTFQNLHVLSGPNMAESSMNINGKKSRSFTVSYILRAKKEGKAVIGPASLEAKGEVYQSKTIEVPVSKAKPKSQKQTFKSDQKPSAEKDLGSEVYIKLFVSDKSPYVGEQIVATYKIYYAIDIVNITPTRPVYNGFYSNELEVNTAAEVSREYINGKPFTLATIKRVLLTPQKSGKLEIEPFDLGLRVRVPQKTNRRGFWGSVFQNYKDVNLEISSNKEIIEVKPLPSLNQPDDYEGAVGSFSVKATVDRTTLNANEAVNYTISISGNGNIDLISDPVIQFPQDFEVYDPKIKKNIRHDATGSSGQKTFEYVIIPRFGGDFELPKVNLSYFDPDKSTYVSKSSDAFTISVAKSGNEQQANGYVPSSKEDVQIIGKDIRFIKTDDPNFTREEDGFFGTGAFYGVSILPILAGSVGWLFLVYFRKQEHSSDAKSRKAGTVARKHIKQAQALLNGKTEEFFEAISKALFGYTSDKLNLEKSDLSRERILEELSHKNVDLALREELKKLLDECDMVRYAPGVVRSPSEMLKATKELIEKLDDVL